MSIAVALLSVALTFAPLGQDTQSVCPDPAIQSSLLQERGVYLGEIHGTEEAPLVVRCLLEAALADGRDVVVSLELSPLATSVDSDIWDGQDGRTSQAMLDLVQRAQALAAAGEPVRLDFHDRFARREPVEWEMSVGNHIRSLSDQAFVIALGGNMHARRSRQEPQTYDPAGNYVGPTIKVVGLRSVQGGAAWVCTRDGCGELTLRASRIQSVPGMVEGGADGGSTDLDLYVANFTASPPARTVPK